MVRFGVLRSKFFVSPPEWSQTPTKHPQWAFRFILRRLCLECSWGFGRPEPLMVPRLFRRVPLGSKHSGKRSKVNPRPRNECQLIFCAPKPPFENKSPGKIQIWPTMIPFQTHSRGKKRTPFQPMDHGPPDCSRLQRCWIAHTCTPRPRDRHAKRNFRLGALVCEALLPEPHGEVRSKPPNQVLWLDGIRFSKTFKPWRTIAC